MMGYMNESSLVSAQVLVVGAGGIGCELLKNLILCGFRNIHVVDLDVIELSNLNRQFLFRRHHIGQPKAKVACEEVLKRCPEASVTPHWANIRDTKQFPLAFFRSFQVVLNALDNLDARRYVNGMCLAVEVPVVESGTAGYLGQCGVILPGQSECFDCIPKEKPKSFPVCTIRTTPSIPLHCVVWAKEYLLSNLFGPPPAEEELPENIDETLLASLKKETDAFRVLKGAGQLGDPQYWRLVFEKVFKDDIKTLLDLPELWEHRETPIPLEPIDKPADGFTWREADDHAIWPLSEWCALFIESIENLAKRAFPSDQEIIFDKDDDDAMNFVASAANIRAHVFGIPLTSRFTLKSMAGNIIPAIATTNAIVAGMIVLQALNILKGEKEKYVNAFVTYGVKRGTLFACEKLSEPNLDCATCHVDRAIAMIDAAHLTLGEFVDGLVKSYNQRRGINYSTEECTILEGTRILFDEDFTSNTSKTMADLHCGDSSFIRVDFCDGDASLIVAIQEHEGLNVFEFTLLSNESRKRPLPEEQDEDDVEPPAKIARHLDDELVIL